jgi:hypothetical protein
MGRHLAHTNNIHVDLLSPRWEAGARNWRWGVALKHRSRGMWRTLTVFAGRPRPDLRFGRGTFSLEAKTWCHTGAGGPGSGTPGTKKYVRLKIGTGYDPLVRGVPPRPNRRERESDA